MSKLFAIPAFLADIGLTQQNYLRWLHRKADAHVKRDRKRSTHKISGSLYRSLIHAAVCVSEGRDFYTGDSLDWTLLSQYDNGESKAERSAYKARFAHLPTVDHVLLDDGRYDFVVCGWRTNDAKSDLGHEEFVELCRKIVAHCERLAAK